VTRQYITLSLIVLLTSIGLTEAALVIGALQPLNPMLIGFSESCTDKPQPCWFGIVPGVTTAEEVHQILTLKHYTLPPPPEVARLPIRPIYEAPPKSQWCNAYMIFDDDERVQFLQLMDCVDIQIGDATGVFGRPDAITLRAGADFLLYEMNFSIALEVARATTARGRVKSIILFASSQRLEVPSVAWHGFAPEWYYQRLEAGAAK
jgi:hypothetical protein